MTLPQAAAISLAGAAPRPPRWLRQCIPAKTSALMLPEQSEHQCGGNSERIVTAAITTVRQFNPKPTAPATSGRPEGQSDADVALGRVDIVGRAEQRRVDRDAL